MSAIRTGVGLASGIDFASIVETLIQASRAPVRRLEQRVAGFQAITGGITTLEAGLLSIGTAVQRLADASTFEALTVQNSDPSQISVLSTPDAVPGTYAFQAIRSASTHQLRSKGFANSDQQSLGTGTITVASGGGLHQSTLLDALNGGDGIRRGSFRIIDRSGASATVDLANAYSTDDVLAAINSSSVAVTATTSGGRIVLTDTSGAAASNLTVTDLNGGHAAEDLGIRQSVASDVLSGSEVYSLTGDFTLDQINDGNGLYRVAGAPDLRITLTDDTVIDVNLDTAVTINDVVSLINDHVDNGGKLAASLDNGRLKLTDLSGGGGSSAFSAEDSGTSSVTRQLGLDVTAAGTTITGRRLLAGLNSVLLSNLRSGAGIDQIGQLQLTDRTGASATIDLAGAESLDEVINAINAAETAGGTKLQLEARVNSTGTGLEVLDTSSAVASNLIIADVGGSTLAQQLGIDVNAAQVSVDSGSLSLRYANEATSLEGYPPDGGSVQQGSFLIVDSAGNQAAVSITSNVTTIGDVLTRINSAAGISVRAELNDTGDGFVLIDEAAGAGDLRVEEIGGTTAADLRILGTGVDGIDGASRITSRLATVVSVAATDTLDDVAQKLSDAGGPVTASVFDDGTPFNSTRLLLSSKTSGAAGRVYIDTGALDLGFNTVSQAQDALLRVGADVAGGFIVASNTNSFQTPVAGLNVDVLAPSNSIATVQVLPNTEPIKAALTDFVNSFNKFAGSAAQLTKFDPETNTRGVLQGQGIASRATDRITSIIHSNHFGPDEPFRSLAELGVRMGEGGKLVFNESLFDAAVQSDPQAVADFFLDEDKGVAGQLDAALDALTDPLTGSFTLEKTALDDSIETINRRITQLDEILAARQERLLREFIHLETIISQLNTQQQAISGISLIKKPA